MSEPEPPFGEWKPMLRQSFALVLVVTAIGLAIAFAIRLFSE